MHKPALVCMNTFAPASVCVCLLVRHYLLSVCMRRFLWQIVLVRQCCCFLSGIDGGEKSRPVVDETHCFAPNWRQREINKRHLLLHRVPFDRICVVKEVRGHPAVTPGVGRFAASSRLPHEQRY